MNPADFQSVLSAVLREQEQRFVQLLDALRVGQSTAAATTPPAQRNSPLPQLSDIESFVMDAENPTHFDDWLKRFEISLLCAAPTISEKEKAMVLATKLSTDAFAEFRKCCLPKDVTDYNYEEAVAKLRLLFSRQRSVFADRYDCMRLTRDEGEEFMHLVNRCKAALKRFKFEELTKEQFDALILLSALKSSTDEPLRARILQKLNQDGGQVRFDDIITDCVDFLTTKADCRVFANENVQLNALQKPLQERRQRRNHPPSQQRQPSKPTAQNVPPSPCFRCGELHWCKDCPHVKHQCSKCERTGHLERQCDHIRNRRSNVKHSKVGLTQICTVHQTLTSNGLMKMEIDVNDVRVQFYLDTGAEVNIISKETFDYIGAPSLQKCDEVARMYNGQTATFLGKGRAKFKRRNHITEDVFYVAPRGSLNLLSYPTMQRLGLYIADEEAVNAVSTKYPSTSNIKTDSMASLKSSFPGVFKDGLGQCTLTKATLTLKQNATPVYRRARPVPYASLPVVEQELDRLLDLGVIKPVRHADWAAPVMVVKKPDGSARLCVDYSTGLNDALQLHQHPLPVPEDIFATLNGGHVFSQIDFSDAYLQVELDDYSRQLCNINTHRGVYEYQRLSFGVKSAPGIFQSIMDNMLAGLPFATAYLDDIIIVSRSQEDHRRHLHAVFQRINEYGFCVRLGKCSFFQPSIKYLGFIIDKDGRRPDPQKVTAVANMPAPNNIATLRSFLGLVNYYQSFVPNMRSIRQPLDDLLKKDNEWNWSTRCQQAFDSIKGILNSDLLLTHYDPSLEVIVAADASEHGLGAVIQHRWPDSSVKAIAHASCSLKPAEQNYSQIEKEGLALIFAVKKFHKYIYGRHFTLLTDHRPLLSIFGSRKGIPVHSANRLQRWAATLLGYDFKIEYRKSTDFGQADALSRLISSHPTPDEEVVVAALQAEFDMEMLTSYLPVTFGKLRTTTQKDELLQSVKEFIMSRWPDLKYLRQHHDWSQLEGFYRRRESLTIEQGCIMFRERVVIPTVLRTKVLKLLHQGHPGIQRMKSLARNYAYWPGMDHDIEEMVHLCGPCATAAKQPPKATLHSWPPATKPWERIHIDFAGPHLGRHFLIVVDAYSKYPDVISMPSTTSRQTVTVLRKLCAQHGVPETIVSDNGTQFTSHEFREFCKANAITHILSPPYHPQSNGRAERFVDTFKRGLLKLRGEGDVDKIMDTFLLAYRTTPNSTLPQQHCPAELFLGRKPRTTLDLLLPTKQPTGFDVKMELQFNRQHGAVVRNFDVGDPVYVRYRQSHEWKAAQVAKRVGGRLYDVTLVDGSTRRFHANQMRPRSTQLTEEEFTEFTGVFDLPVRRPQAASGETGPVDEHAVEHNQEATVQENPSVNNSKSEQSSVTCQEPRRSKRGHIPKKQFELDPRRKTYQYP
jgi:transposase InsO family protein